VTLVSVNTSGTGTGNDGSNQAVMTPDGRYILFQSFSTNIITTADSNNTPDVFVRDLQTQTTRLVSTNLAGTDSPNDFSNVMSITPDGRFAVFQSFATNITNVPDTNGVADLFIRDLRNGRTEVVSLNDFATSTANAVSTNAYVSNDGRFVNFESNASNIVVNDLNGVSDLFRYRSELAGGQPQSDFDGDGRSDLAVFRPPNGVWYLNRSTAGFTSLRFGQAGDLVTPEDFDGDSRTDVAVFRAGVWYVYNSSNQTFTVFNFGSAGDWPVARDFDGDRKADFTVFRPSNGTWYINRSSDQVVRTENFGLGGDWANPADFDGDGRADLAVFRPSNGVWYVLRSTAGFLSVQFGQTGDRPVPGDFDGDGKTDLAVWRPGNGNWFVLRSTDGGFGAVTFGLNGDDPVVGDYDGDGKADYTIYRNGTWYQLLSTGGNSVNSFGLAGDVAISTANVYVP
jgi:hypothetical protein